MRLAFFSVMPFEKKAFDKVNQLFQYDIHYFEEKLNERNVVICEGFDAICVFVNDQVNSECVEQLAKYGIRYILTRSAGFNHIDIETCKRLAISVAYVPEYSPDAIAEHTMALLLTLNRKTHRAYNRIREHNFSIDGLMGKNLNGKTVGIIGLGRIGKCFAKICLGFGMRVIAYDVTPEREFSEQYSIEIKSLEALLRQSDIISLHCPLTQDNHHLIDDKAIAKMKLGAFLLNTGRGALIDSNALIAGLKSAKLAGVALDVYEHEKAVFFEDHSNEIITDDILMRLTTFPNVLITSHQGFLTEEAVSEIVHTTFHNLQALETGTPCENTIC